MKSKRFSTTVARAVKKSVLLLASAAVLLAQSPRLTVSDPAPLTVKRGGTAELKLTATLNEGFHANSHTPSDENLIPLKLTWEPGSLTAKDVVYPKPQMEKYAFSETKLSVVTGTFDLTTKFSPAAGAQPGSSTLMGKIHYQACNDRACFAPKTVEVKVPVTIQ